MKRWWQATTLVCWIAASASAQPTDPTSPPDPPAEDVDVAPAAVEVTPASPPAASPPAAPPPVARETASPIEPSEDTAAPELTVDSSFLSQLHVHGFVSQGAFVSTDNEYIGASSRGSLRFLEVGINVSVELTEQLRIGMQLVSRNVGVLSEDVPRLDWGLADYRFNQWFGLRAGVIKIPLGLYNEYVDIDAARTAILLPQSMYPLRNRDALISHTGFAAYGTIPLSSVGELEYQAWLGTLSIPRSALILDGGSLDSVDTKYVTGLQLFWRPPIEGLRVGATYLRASVDFNVTLDEGVVAELVMADLVPADFTGGLVISQRPTGFWVASAEYIHGDWTFAAEYSRWLKHQQTTLPQVIPTLDEDSERFYAMVVSRLSQHFALGVYYSVLHADADDRTGKDIETGPRSRAFQRDLALSLRFDINDYWLWKVEGHLIDGTADLDATRNASPERTWGLFLLRTTVTF